MRWLAIAVIGAALMVHGQEAKPHSNANKRNSATESKDATDTAGQTVVVVNQQAPQGQQNDHAEQPRHSLHELLLPQNIPNVALVLVGIAGIVIAVRTLKALRSQAGIMRGQLEAMQGQIAQMENSGAQTAELIKHAAGQVTALADSAQAAKEMAEAARITAMAAENGALAASASARAARVSADALISAERPWLSVSVEQIQGASSAFLHQFSVKNLGRTPAMIVGASTMCVV